MKELVSPLAVIVRYLMFALAGKYFPGDAFGMMLQQPELSTALSVVIEASVSALLGAAAIIWWRLSKKFGWPI